MAILLYANGITEEYKPEGHTFSDEELIKIQFGKAKIRSFRLYEVPNTWCIWGERQPENTREDEFDKIGTEIVDQPCYAPVLFIHDSEINPDWRLTDDVILTGYDGFKKELLQFFDDVAQEILKEREQQNSNSPLKFMNLEQVGISADKRVIFKFNLDKQLEEFFIHENLLEFARKVHNFLKFSYRNGDTFAIFADKNIIIIMDDDQVQSFIEKIVALFESRENYEACSVIRNTYQKWMTWKKENSKAANKKGPEKKK
jgi:hypothetical protein